jgi:uncharacterized SAM-binding protein YcdF (DUF218 family)
MTVSVIKLTMKTIVFILIILGFLSCTQKKQITQIPLDIYRCLNCAEDPRNDSPPYSSLKIVKLQTNENCLITYIKQIEVTDSLMYVLDVTMSMKKHLFVFNNAGDFLAQISRYGEAPDEYGELNTFYIDSTGIVIVDDVKGALIKFDFHGKYLETKKIPIEFVWMSGQAVLTEDEKLLVFHGMNMRNNMAYSLINMKNYELIDRYFSYNPIKLNKYIYFFSAHPISKCMEKIHFILPICDTVYSYPSFLPAYIVETPRRMASKNQISQNTDAYTKDIRDLNKSGYFTGFTALYETKKHVYLECKYDGVVLGYFFADKATKQGNYYFGGQAENTKIPFFYIIGATDNSLIGMATSESLSAYKFKFEDDYAEGQQLKNICSSMLEDDNPILFFYEFK